MTIKTVTILFLVFYFLDANARLSSPESLISEVSCSYTSPLDEFLRCLQRNSLYPAENDSVQLRRKKLSEIKQHPKLSNAACFSPGTSVQNFRDCLFGHIQAATNMSAREKTISTALAQCLGFVNDLQAFTDCAFGHIRISENSSGSSTQDEQVAPNTSF